jgi:hypothetical protein
MTSGIGWPARTRSYACAIKVAPDEVIVAIFVDREANHAEPDEARLARSLYLCRGGPRRFLSSRS